MVDSWNAAQLNEAVQNGSISGGGSDLPDVTASDNGDVLTVVGGVWDKATPTSLPFKTKILTDNGGSGTVTIDPELPEGATIIGIRGMATRADTSVRYSLPILAPQADYSTVTYLSSGDIVVQAVDNKYNITDIVLIVDYIEAS